MADFEITITLNKRQARHVRMCMENDIEYMSKEPDLRYGEITANQVFKKINTQIKKKKFNWLNFSYFKGED